jgi:hypothetical protein
MGFLRGGSLVLLSVLLFLGIIVQGLFLTLYLSLGHDSVNSELSAVAFEFIEGKEMLEEISAQRPMLEIYCQNNSELPFSNPLTNTMENISCAELLESPEVFIQNRISKSIEEKYYWAYDCNFFDCIEKTEDPFSLVSKHAQDYWKVKFFSFLIISFLLLLGIFFLTKDKSNFFILSSVLFIASSLIFLKLKFILDVLFVFIFGIGKELGSLSFSSFLELFSVFLTKSSFVFMLFLIIGILFFIIGICIKLIGISSEVSEFIDRFVGWFKKKPNIQSVSQMKSSEKDIKKLAVKRKDS